MTIYIWVHIRYNSIIWNRKYARKVKDMQILTGSKREITLMQWNEQLEKAKKKLEESKKCYELFGDEDSKQWVEDEQKKVNKIEQQIKEVIAFMDANNIK